jgi:hypothetical protein
MYSLIVRHKVADFDKWHASFLSFSHLNARHGATDPEVYRATDDPNDVTLKQDFATLAEIQAMMGSEEIREAMGKAGVVGPPSVLIAEKIEAA